MDKSPTKNDSKRNIEAISQQLKEESTTELSLFDNIKVPISTKNINFRNSTYQDIAKKMGSTYHLSDLNETIIHSIIHLRKLLMQDRWMIRIVKTPKNMFTNYLRHTKILCGHNASIFCLATLQGYPEELASGSLDKTIKVWDIKRKVMVCTLSAHREAVSALCYMNKVVLVSGSKDKSLIVWQRVSDGYIIRHILTDHQSGIKGIVKINEEEVISAEFRGHVRMWNITQGTCTKHINISPYIIDNIKKFQLDNLNRNIDTRVSIITYRNIWETSNEGISVLGTSNECGSRKINLWGASNNWERPYQVLDDENLEAIEFIDGNLFLLAKQIENELGSELVILDHMMKVLSQYPPINLYCDNFTDILRIAKNIVFTVNTSWKCTNKKKVPICDSGKLRVIDPIIYSSFG